MGGLPGMYLPNHAGTTSLKEMGAAIIRGFHASAVAVADLEAFVRDIPAQLKQHVPAKYMSPNFEII